MGNRPIGAGRRAHWAEYGPRYESSPDVLDRAPALFPAHKARLDEFAARGVLFAVGTFAGPVADGSMAIFATRQDAEAFAQDDPFVTGGAVRSWRVLEWN